MKKTGSTVVAAGLLILLAAGCGSSTSVLQNGEEEIREEEQNQETETEEVTSVYVHVTGAVQNPGVYVLPGGSRVFQAIERAGGVTDQAEAGSMNQAAILEDGQQIRILTKEEAQELKEAGKDLYSLQTGTEEEITAGKKVDINTADKEELMTLTGIGETRAEAILAFRRENGAFSAPEDLMLVEGIKEKTFEKLKDQITVN